jgi:hypothetical protein
MPIVYGPNNVLISMIWESANFASGNGATVIGLELGLASPENARLAAEQVVEAFDTVMQPAFDVDYTLATVHYETDTLSGDVSAGLAGGGSITGPSSNCTLLTSYYSQFKGRRNRGRNYWPGLLTEGAIDERGVVLTGTLATLTTMFDNFWDVVVDGTLVTNQCIAQSVVPGSVTPPIVPWPRVANRVIQPIIGTQRRRVRP